VPLLLIICQESGNKLHGSAAHVQIFCQDLLANSKTDPSGVCELMDCSATVIVNEFLNFFNIFCQFMVTGHPECLSSSTDTQLALKCIQKLLSGLKNVLQKLREALQEFQ
jgi:hypothetical protein